MTEYVDDFSGYPNGALSNQANWTVDGDKATLVVDNGAAEGNTTNTTYANIWDGDGTWGLKQRAKITLGAVGDYYTGVLVHASPSGHIFARATWGSPANRWDIFHQDYDAGTFDAIVSTNGWITSEPGQGDTIELLCEDDPDGDITLTLRHNGQLVWTGDVNRTIPNGKPGIYTKYAGSPPTRIGQFAGEDFAGSVAPSLTNARTQNVGTNSADALVDTDVGDGTMYLVVSTDNAQPSVAQMKAGQNASGTAAVFSSQIAVSQAGTVQDNATGLSQATAYYAHFMHERASGEQSSVVTASFTTASPSQNLGTGGFGFGFSFVG